jgi:hypothetical protein
MHHSQCNLPFVAHFLFLFRWSLLAFGDRTPTMSTTVGLGGADSSAILARAYCGGHVGWLWLNFWDGVEGCVLFTLDDGGKGLSGWVMGLIGG